MIEIKKFAKKYIVVWLCLLLTLILVSCSKEIPSIQEEEEEPKAHTSLDLLITAYSEHSANYWNTFKVQFESRYDYIDLNIEVLNWAEINERMRNEISKMPDILLSDRFVEYAQAGLLEDADEYITPEMRANILSNFYRFGEVSGKVYGLPALANCRGLVCNMDILEKAGVGEVPKTWNDLINVCEKIKSSIPDVTPLGIDLSEENGISGLSCFFWNNEGGFFDSNGDININTPENAEALKFIKNLYEAGYCNGNVKRAEPELSNSFETGNIAMMIDGVGHADKWKGKNIKVGGMPKNTSSASINYGVCDKFVVFKKEMDTAANEVRREALQIFFDSFYNPDNYSLFVKNEGFLPITVDSIENIKESGALGVKGEFLELLENAQLNPTYRSDWDDIRFGIIYTAWDVLSGEDSAKALELLQTQIN